MKLYENLAEINNIDQQGMFNVIKEFPLQVRKALEIGESFDAPDFSGISKKIIILGMGGSAIGGDILRSYLAGTDGSKDISISINRNYDIPGYVDKDTIVIASSYSGGTEETLSGFDQTMKRTSLLVAISSGGELSNIAEKNSIPLIKIPGGLQPRAALGYSFFPLLKFFLKSRLISGETADKINNEIDETLSKLDELSAELSDINVSNPAVNIAGDLNESIPVIYSASEILDSVNVRWRCQIQENAKQACFGNFLPEMNHNEINGWSFPDGIKNRCVVLFLKDKNYHPKTLRRFDALESILSKEGIKILKFESSSDSLLTRTFELIYLGDWVSYYMALLNGTDPTPIPLISDLKRFMSDLR
jgi:glucose/mannose-6-phosphate isomerase